jgi:DNA-nicking Smr family endonuclease
MSRRRLSDDERTLWSGVTRSIAPLRRWAPAAAEMPAETAAAAAPSRALATPKPNPKPNSKPKSASAPASVRAPAPPPLAPLGRRFKQEVARGRRSIDGRLDLHGMTQAQAHDALLRFLRAGQARGTRIVLVITGKGTPGDDYLSERGVLRRQVPRWLRLPEFRQFVVGFEAAGPGHGGEGALYVSLRRPRAARD